MVNFALGNELNTVSLPVQNLTLGKDRAVKELNTLTLTSTNIHTSCPEVQDINCEATSSHTQKETLQIYLRYSLSRVGAE